jgi:hypothetical protein
MNSMQPRAMGMGAYLWCCIGSERARASKAQANRERPARATQDRHGAQGVISVEMWLTRLIFMRDRAEEDDGWSRISKGVARRRAVEGVVEEEMLPGAG